MALFRDLNDDIFLLFSRAGRHLHARVVIDLFDHFFAEPTVFPGRNEVVGRIYDTLRAHPTLWTDDIDTFGDVADIKVKGRRVRKGAPAQRDDRQDLILGRAQRAYNRLLATGWLEEEAFGLKVTVDMPPAAMWLAERLVDIDKGLATSFRGVVVTIRNALAAVVLADSATNAAGLHKAAEMTLRFSRELRAVVSSLRGIERDIMAAGSLGERLSTFFEDFVERLVLRDFESIYKTNHPYRFKHEILGYADGINDDGNVRTLAIEGYVESEIAPRAAAGQQLDADLLTLRTVFDSIDETYQRIDAFRIRLEARLRNTVRYAETANMRQSQRLSALICRLDQALGTLVQEEDTDWLAEHEADGPVVEDTAPWSSALLAEPRMPRKPVSSAEMRLPSMDPAIRLRHAMLRRYNDLFIVSSTEVTRFLEQRIPPSGTGEARYMRIDSVEDFLAFEQLRRYRHRAPDDVLARFEFRPDPEDGFRDDEWLLCRNFLVRRISDHVTMMPPGKDPA